MTAENRCPHPITKVRTVPLETYPSPESPGNRLPTAAWHTCTRCGASFYLDETFVQAGSPVPAPSATPAVQETWDC